MFGLFRFNQNTPTVKIWIKNNCNQDNFKNTILRSIAKFNSSRKKTDLQKNLDSNYALFEVSAFLIFLVDAKMSQGTDIETRQVLMESIITENSRLFDAHLNIGHSDKLIFNRIENYAFIAKKFPSNFNEWTQEFFEEYLTRTIDMKYLKDYDPEKFYKTHNNFLINSQYQLMIAQYLTEVMPNIFDKTDILIEHTKNV